MKNTSLKDKNLRVLFIVPLPPPYAGPEVSSEILLNSPLKDQCHLLCLPNNINRRNDQKGRITPLTVGRLLVLLLRMVKIIIVQRPSVVYTILTQNVSGFIRDSLLVLTAKLFGKKMVMHFRGSAFNNFYNARGVIFRKYIRFILGLTDAIILQAEWVKTEIFKGFVPEEKLHVVYNAVSPDFLSGTDNMQRNGDGARITVLFLNHLSVAKGLLVLLEAAKQVVAQTENIDFVIAGDTIGKERNILRDKEGKGIIFKDITSEINAIVENENFFKRIKFPGEITDLRTKLELFSAADIFTLPSYSEGLPLSVVEAMAAELPVVVTPVGGLVDILKDGENGFFVKTGDATELKNRIIALAENAALRQYMGKKNKSQVKERMNADVIASQLYDILKQVEGRQGGCLN